MQSQLEKKREAALRALGPHHVLATKSSYPRHGWKTGLVSKLNTVRAMARRAGRID